MLIDCTYLWNRICGYSESLLLMMNLICGKKKLCVLMVFSCFVYERLRTGTSHLFSCRESARIILYKYEYYLG
jgi:hypothetical protein